MAVLVSFFAGTATLMFFTGLLSTHLIALICIGILLAGLAMYRIIARPQTGCFPTLPTLLTCVAAFFLGTALAHARAQWVLDHSLDAADHRADFLLAGRVTALPEMRRAGHRDYQRIIVDVVSIQRVDTQSKGLANNRAVADLPRRVRLNVYQPLDIRLGDQWSLPVRLTHPTNFANPGGFDYVRYLLSRKIGATGYVRKSVGDSAAVLVKRGPQRWYERWRMARVDALDALLDDGEVSAVLRALLVGDRRGLSVDLWQVLGRTGTAHLVAISGMHIGIVAAFAFVVGRFLFAVHPALGLHLPRSVLCALFALPFAGYYATLAGFALPTIRALAMLAVAIALVVWRWRSQPLSILCFVLCACVLVDPLTLLGQSLWFSFIAVLLLVCAMDERRRPLHAVKKNSSNDGFVLLKKGRIIDALWPALRNFYRAQLAIFFGLAMPLVMLGGSFSAIAPLANAVAIPLVGFIVVPIAMTGLLLSPIASGLSVLLFHAAGEIISIVLEVLRALDAGSPVLHGAFANAPAYLVAVTLAIVPVLLCSWRAPGFVAALLVWLTLAVPATRSTDPLHEALKLGGFSVTQIDVGQGTALLVRTRNHSLLYDSGPIFSSRFNAGDAIILPYLSRIGVAQLDSVVVSHSDGDHAGGAAAIARALTVGQWWSGAPVSEMSDNLFVTASHYKPIRKNEQVSNSAAIEACRAGIEWWWDGVHFAFLHPPAFDQQSGYSAAMARSDNDGSCVLQISTRGDSQAGSVPGGSDELVSRLLLTGDISREVEYRLLAEYGAALSSDIVSVPHHGSRTSSGHFFVEQLGARFALVSAGFGNRYGHPAAAVRQRYEQAGARLLQSASAGAIGFRVSRNGTIEGPFCARHTKHHFWENVDNTGLCVGPL